jgi:hypothetical protein
MSTDTDTIEPTPIERTEEQQKNFERAIDEKVGELLNATRECFAIVGRPQYFQDYLLKIAYDVLDLDPALVEGGWEHSLGFRWTRELRPTWGLHTTLTVQFQTPYRSDRHEPLRKEYAEKLDVDVSWPSGGGNPAKAVAQASQHLELAQQATRVELVYQRAVMPPENRYSRFAKGDPGRILELAFLRLHEMREEAWAKISAEGQRSEQA